MRSARGPCCSPFPNLFSGHRVLETVAHENSRKLFAHVKEPALQGRRRNAGNLAHFSDRLLAINAATKSLAIEYASKGVRVNAVAPGVIKTPMHAPGTHEFLSKLHPVGRMGETADIVGAILFLESASFITGAILHVDGGQSAGH